VTSTKLIETDPGKYSLLLTAGTTLVDGVLSELGYEAHGYFWEAVARYLVDTDAPGLAGRFAYDSEGGMFCAYGTDQEALEELAVHLDAVATEPERARDMIAAAQAAGVDLDD
jgi:hypothetical protein